MHLQIGFLRRLEVAAPLQLSQDWILPERALQNDEIKLHTSRQVQRAVKTKLM